MFQLAALSGKQPRHHLTTLWYKEASLVLIHQPFQSCFLLFVASTLFPKNALCFPFFIHSLARRSFPPFRYDNTTHQHTFPSGRASSFPQLPVTVPFLNSSALWEPFLWSLEALPCFSSTLPPLLEYKCCSPFCSHHLEGDLTHNRGSIFLSDKIVNIISKYPILAIAKHEEASFRDLGKTLLNFEITNKFQSCRTNLAT